MRIEIDSDLAETIRHLEAEWPNTGTWHGRMVAVTDGVVDFDDIEPLLLACANIADEALRAEPRRKAEANANGKIDITPAWHETISAYWDSFAEIQSDHDDPRFKSMCAAFQKCGEVADWWLAKNASHLTTNETAGRLLKKYQAQEPGGFQTWPGVMAGICFGGVDGEDVFELATACAAVAHESLAAERKRQEEAGQLDTTFHWPSVIAYYSRHFLGILGNAHSVPITEMRRMFHECGAAADAWLETKANGR